MEGVRILAPIEDQEQVLVPAQCLTKMKVIPSYILGSLD